MTKKTSKLTEWQRRLHDGDTAFADEVEKMDEREALYDGDRTLRPLVPGDQNKNGTLKQTSHVRNIIFENIEAQISSEIPQPKVTAMREEDEHLAEIIERFLRNELDRLPFEEINDMCERTVPLQGGVGYLVEWDNSKCAGERIGEIVVTDVHPKQISPQPGVYTGVRDMDWIIIKLPTTKEQVRRKYGVSVADESESEPEVRTADGQEYASDAVTQYIGYATNDHGGIDRYSWVNDVELEDIEDYQSRRQPVCKQCGRKKPLPGQEVPRNDTADPESGETPETRPYSGGACPWCGGTEFTDEKQEYEEIWLPITTATMTIPGMHMILNDDGLPELAPTRIPFYRPDVYPIVLQKSVSKFGKLLGTSDADVIQDQQNTVNRMEQKVIDRLVKAGTRITLPPKARLRTDPEDGERWHLENPADKQLIDVYQFSGNLEYELGYLSQVYEEARQIIGVTDSFQGRRDTTATSGKAKEFAAAQSAGRLQSKRTMKQAAYAHLFELMFKFALAYSDEPRPVHYKDSRGDTKYAEFNRYDFLRQDAEGDYYWDDDFLFSCDQADTLANNREAMWQETRLNLQTGAFGDPAQTETLIIFWTKMEELHYPGAGATKKFLEDRLEREQAAQAQMQAQQMAQQMTIPPAGYTPPGTGYPPNGGIM